MRFSIKIEMMLDVEAPTSQFAKEKVFDVLSYQKHIASGNSCEIWRVRGKTKILSIREWKEREGFLASMVRSHAAPESYVVDAVGTNHGEEST